MTVARALQCAFVESNGDLDRAKNYLAARIGKRSIGSQGISRAHTALCKAAKEFRAERTGRDLSPCRNLRWQLDGSRIVCAEFEQTNSQNDKAAS